ncbi:MAG: T9SS type A sorting domain-containing protein [candidate division Zixibacteria bacterium]|nr:T9SS type A sorting domain-containing protein [candidate division Zixibacteria bacterium]
MGDQNIDPQFVDKETDNYNLQPTSPCIGTGRYDNDRGALPFEPTYADNNKSLPEDFMLLNNYPNPFNAATTISYILPEPTDVTIEIYDMLGGLIEALHSGSQSAGEHSLNWNANSYSSGIYFYKITAGEFEQTEKMTLLK